MAEILPFRALRYNPAKVGKLDRVVTQPYDKISAGMQERYYDLSPYNLVRIIRGRAGADDSSADNVYTRAARSLREWIGAGVLVPDSEPAIYPYHQEYAAPGAAETRRRRGFIALCRLEDYSARVVHRHEETLSGPKADRLELLRATRAHFGQIFVLYGDPAEEIDGVLDVAAPPSRFDVVTDEYGTRHFLGRVTSAEAIERVTAAMRERKLVIADGHHRYETALAYRDLCRAQGRNGERAEYVMMTFIRKESEGLTILPTHRVIHSLPSFDWPAFQAEARRFFTTEVLAVRKTAPLRDALRKAGSDGPAFAAYAGAGKAALLRLRADLNLAEALADVADGLRPLDVVILHRLLLEQVLGIDQQAVREERNLRYVREFQDSLAQVDGGRAQLALLMNPTPVDAVWANALAGQPLPQKSTDFYPKLLSGLAAYWLDNPAGI
ncbi:MAG: DUF1015 domain-containing protein [Terriglobia bacterium]